MNTRILLIAVVLIISAKLSAQSSGDYRSNAATMNWSTATNWETFDGASWVTAVASPTSADGQVEIRTGHTVSFDANATVDQVTINGTLSINAGITLTVGSGIVSGTARILVNSGGVLTNNGSINQNGTFATRIIRVLGTYNMNQGGTVTGNVVAENVFESGATYNHNYTTTSGSILNATWNTGSTCAIIGYTTNNVAPANLSQNFANFTWNLTNLNLGGGSIELEGQPANISGNYSILSTGSNGDPIVLNTSTLSATITVAGNFNITSGNVVVNLGTGNSTTIDCESFSVLGADVTFSDGTSTINVSGDATLSSGSLNYGAGTADINFIGTTSQNYTRGATISGNINFKISDNAIVNLGSSNYFEGSGTFILEPLGTLQTGITSASGVIQNGTSAGAIRVAGARTINAGATIELNGSATQFLGSGTPSNINITINNSSEVRLASNLTLSAGSTITFNSGNLDINGRTFTLNGSVANMSTTRGFTGSSSSNLTIGGSGAAGTLFFNPSTDRTTNVIQNLSINRSSGSVTLGNTLNISRLLTVSVGTLNTGGFLTMMSQPSQTAEIANSAGTISGNVTVERHIPSVGRRFRFLASPVGSTSFSNSWQQNTHITGPSGASNGFDATSSNSPSCFTYNETLSGASSNGWTTIPNTTSTNLTPGVGYRVFIRGSRTAARLSGTDNSQDAVTLTATGALAVSPQIITLGCSNGCGSNDDGWRLAGNPYQATIDWVAVTKSNVDATAYIFNPNTNAYEWFNSSTLASSTNGSRYISPGQAFFVRSNAASSSITVTESHKATFGNANDLFKTGNQLLENILKIELKDSSGIPHSNSFIGYADSASDGYDGTFDAFNLSSSINNQISSINQGGIELFACNVKNKSRFQLTNFTDSFNLRLTLPSVVKTYKLSFNNHESFDPSLQLYLVDKFLQTTVNLSNATEYVFTTNSNIQTFQNRFTVLVNKVNSALPAKLIKFTAFKLENNVLVNWQTAQEINTQKFIVEKSIDGLNYYQIGDVKAKGNSTIISNYSFDDNSSIERVMFYRLKIIDTNGSFEYSNVITINTDILEVSEDIIHVYPNPVTENHIKIKSNNINNKVKEIRLLDMVGKPVSIELVKTNPLDDGQYLLSESISKGVYFLNITDINGKVHTIKLIKE